MSVNMMMNIPKKGSCLKYTRRFSQEQVSKKDPTGHCQHFKKKMCLKHLKIYSLPCDYKQTRAKPGADLQTPSYFIN